MDEQKDLLGGYNEMELIELGEAEVYGGTVGTDDIVSGLIASAIFAFAPTFRCTSKCGT